MSGTAGQRPWPSEVYISEAVERECERVVRAPPHEANNTLFRAAVNIGQMEGAGWLDRGFAEQRLEQAAAQRCNDTTEALTTIRSGLDAGRRNPREWRNGSTPALRPKKAAKPTKAAPADRRERAEQIWARTATAEGTLAAVYLSARGLGEMPIPKSLKFGSRVMMGKHGEHPALIAEITNPVTGVFYAIQRTGLAIDGRGKAAIKPAKQSLGPMEDGAVVLGNIVQAPIILEGEGIETVLSACQSTGLPGIATLGAERLGKPQLPPDAEVIVLADLGSEDAARKGAERRIAENRKVRIAIPPTGAGKDFNDTLRQLGSDEVRAAIDCAQHITPRKSYVARSFADIEPKPIEWLWQKRIALGRLSLLAGRPGLGKSQLTLCFAATVSRGGTWPDGSVSPRGGVILITCEDDVADTVAPRLMACGADRKAIHFLDSIVTDEDGQRVFDLQNGIEPLRDMICDIGDVRLIVIDPISAYEGRADSHRNSEVRQLLQPLQDLAAKSNAAILIVTHLNKGTMSGSADTRVNGSGAYVAASRSCWLVEEHEDDAGKSIRAFAPIKNNIGNDREGFTYGIETCEVAGGITTSRAVFTSGPVPLHASDLIGSGKAATKERPRQIDDASEFLTAQLNKGPASSKELQIAAKAAGLGWRTVQRAKDDLGVLSRKSPGKNGAWQWQLPPPAQPELALEDGQQCQDGQTCQECAGKDVASEECQNGGDRMFGTLGNVGNLSLGCRGGDA